MDYLSAKEAAERWGVSQRRVEKLCEQNRIEGLRRFGRYWMIPMDAKKPADPRRAKGGKFGQPGKDGEADDAKK